MIRAHKTPYIYTYTHTHLVVCGWGKRSFFLVDGERVINWISAVACVSQGRVCVCDGEKIIKSGAHSNLRFKADDYGDLCRVVMI